MIFLVLWTSNGLTRCALTHTRGQSSYYLISRVLPNSQLFRMRRWKAGYKAGCHPISEKKSALTKSKQYDKNICVYHRGWPCLSCPWGCTGLGKTFSTQEWSMKAVRKLTGDGSVIVLGWIKRKENWKDMSESPSHSHGIITWPRLRVLQKQSHDLRRATAHYFPCLRFNKIMWYKRRPMEVWGGRWYILGGWIQFEWTNQKNVPRILVLLTMLQNKKKNKKIKLVTRGQTLSSSILSPFRWKRWSYSSFGTCPTNIGCTEMSGWYE